MLSPAAGSGRGSGGFWMALERVGERAQGARDAWLNPAAPLTQLLCAGALRADGARFRFVITAPRRPEP